ncbi:SDR family NAD(P)-dependent oxidoreductase [Nocardia sp. 2]|uniref:SDR family NAD(P)-dependent oxidoreductase n=1 Tax=Nocardia acididurans TaxID=2802282 RepID=A0ABS1MBP9_9NOCA|nr:SDR family NAD(P)-dependent oxidoreductase [Nocardia acididurans]
MPWTAADIPELSGRTAVVTGASAGLGLETARMLAERGARVVMACRNAEKAAGAVEFVRQTAPTAELPVLELDLTSLESVRAAAARLPQLVERVDLLINNAGTMNQRRLVTVDGFENTFATNHLGPFAFTGLVLDLVLAAPGARIVTVASAMAETRKSPLDLDDLAFEQRRYRTMTAYAQSKLANLMFTQELQRKLNGTDVELCAVAAHPGIAVTEFTRNLPASARWLAHPSVQWLFNPIQQTATMGALPTLRAAVDPGVRGGEFFGPAGKFKGFPVPLELTGQASDPVVSDALWAASEKLTGVVFRIGEEMTSESA